jgi:hypothetical protein
LAADPREFWRRLDRQFNLLLARKKGVPTLVRICNLPEDSKPPPGTLLAER